MTQEKPLPIRDAITSQHRLGINAFAETGTWLSAGDRLAILEEFRHCGACRLCAARKTALSPYSVDGDHDCLDNLPRNIIEVIHRVKSDSGRLTHRWFQSVLDTGLLAEEYIEIVGLLAIVIILDSFSTGIGHELLRPDVSLLSDKTPDKIKNPKVVDEGAWVPLLEAQSVEGKSGLPAVPNIARAMGLVPLAMQQFFLVMRVHYNLDDLDYDINRRQVELIAARVSSHNACFY